MLKIKLNNKDKVSTVKEIPYSECGVTNDFLYFYTSEPHSFVTDDVIRIENTLFNQTFVQDVEIYVPENGINVLGTYETLKLLENAHPVGSNNDVYFINESLSYYKWDGQWVKVNEDDLFYFASLKNLIKMPKFKDINLELNNAVGLKLNNPNNNDVIDAVLLTFNNPLITYQMHDSYNVVAGLDTYSGDIEKLELKTNDYIIYGGSQLFQTIGTNNFRGPLNSTISNIYAKTSSIRFELKDCIIPVRSDGNDDKYHLIWIVPDTVVLDDGEERDGDVIKSLLISNNKYVSITQKDNRFVESENNEIKIRSTVKLFKYSDFYEVEIPFSHQVANNLFQDDIVNNDYVNKEKDKAINPIINMEKTVFVPTYIKKAFNESTVYNTKTDKNLEGSVNDVDEIEFNFHFRDRFKYDDNGRIIEPYSFVDNWVTQNGVYWNGYKYDSATNALVARDRSITYGDSQSDLLGYLNFTTSDVNFQKSKLKKSFIRLLFYDSRDIKRQKLLFYSTIFVDTGELFGRYARNVEQSGYVNVTDPNNPTEVKGIGVMTEYKGGLNEDKRLSTRITVYDKYNRYKSSEGFYIYLFADNAPKIRPETIYMKVEYNHAGYGRTIPMMMPVGENNIPISITDTNFPANGFTDINNTQKLDMQSYYKSLFIELKVVYDSTYNNGSGRYVYFLPHPIDNDDRKIIFNLFEAKIQ